MAFDDLLLPILSYPDETPEMALDAAASLAQRLGGSVTALALAVDLPDFRNRLVNALTGIDEMARTQEAMSVSAAHRLGEAFAAKARGLGIGATVQVEQQAVYTTADRVRDLARTRDATLLTSGPKVLEDVSLAETVLFGSGRPIVLFAEESRLAPGAAFSRAILAWDGSRCAARAIADAMPLLPAAGEVRILSVLGEKPGVEAGITRDLLRHLETHGIAARPAEVDADGRSIGQVLRGYVEHEEVDLLVMGGFGHSRAREMILGGATSSILEAPPCCTLMSH
jgi:nucleotide-binding universal stress UspA family protein